MLPWLWPKGRPELRFRAFVAVLLLPTAKAAAILAPWLLAHVIDTLGVSSSPTAPATSATSSPGTATELMTFTLSAIAPYVFGLLGAYVLAWVTTRLFVELRNAVFAKVAQNAVREMALQVFRHLYRLPLSFHIKRRSGALARAIDRGVKGVEFLLFFSLFTLAPTILEILFVCIVLWSMLDWSFPAILCSGVVLYLLFTFVVTEYRNRLRRRMNKADNAAADQTLDCLMHYEAVKSFGNEDFVAQHYDQVLKGYEKITVRTRISLTLLNGGQVVIVAFFLGILMILASMRVAAGEMSIGTFVMVHSYVLQIAIPLGFFGSVYRQIRQSLVDLETMFSLLHAPGEREGSRPPSLRISGGEVRFSDVSFRYENGRRILEDVDLRIRAGRSVALIGESGCGKSTLTRLLLRFYRPRSGNILIDGQDIQSVCADSVRRAVGIAPQEAALFHQSIRWNVAFGRPEASLSEIREAVEAVGLDTLVASVSGGLEAVIGERGLNISGGERQRIALARVFLKAPPIVVLDEATSALDTKSEQFVLGNLRKRLGDRSLLVIAHRLSTVSWCDEISVLNRGRIHASRMHASRIHASGMPDSDIPASPT